MNKSKKVFGFIIEGVTLDKDDKVKVIYARLTSPVNEKHKIKLTESVSGSRAVHQAALDYFTARLAREGKQDYEYEKI